MTGKELAEEIRSIITYLCEVSGKQDKYALECCDELDKKLEVLDILKSKSSLISNEDSWLCLNIDKINMFKDEFDKIMRWLENENKEI